MESHKRILGIIFTVSSVFQTLIAFFLNILFATIFSFAASQADPEDAAVVELVGKLLQWLPAIIILFFAIPTLIAGIGLLSNKSWAMILALVMGCFKLFSFPIGTAIGIYTIWVYSEDQKQTKAATQQKA
jgi:ABC-type sulfate transport system permease component